MKRMKKVFGLLLSAALISGCATSTVDSRENPESSLASSQTSETTVSDEDFSELKDALRREGLNVSETTDENGALNIDALNDQGSMVIHAMAYSESKLAQEAFSHQIELLKNQDYEEEDTGESDQDQQKTCFLYHSLNNAYTCVAADLSRNTVYVFEDYLKGNQHTVESILHELGFEDDLNPSEVQKG